MFTLLIEKQVQKRLEKIPNPYYSNIKVAINNLSLNPRPMGCLKLKGRPGYRIRIGNYRIIYEINDRESKLYILEVGNRKDVYR